MPKLQTVVLLRRAVGANATKVAVFSPFKQKSGQGEDEVEGEQQQTVGGPLSKQFEFHNYNNLSK